MKNAIVKMLVLCSIWGWLILTLGRPNLASAQRSPSASGSQGITPTPVPTTTPNPTPGTTPGATPVPTAKPTSTPGTTPGVSSPGTTPGSNPGNPGSAAPGTPVTQEPGTTKPLPTSGAAEVTLMILLLGGAVLGVGIWQRARSTASK